MDIKIDRERNKERERERNKERERERNKESKREREGVGIDSYLTSILHKQSRQRVKFMNITYCIG